MDTGLGSGWLVIDAFDIMVHVFTQENRRKYALESLWKDAEEIAVSKVLVTEKKVSAKSKSKRTAKRTTQPPKSKKRRSNKK
jgi:ribosome-associated protein